MVKMMRGVVVRRITLSHVDTSTASVVWELLILILVKFTQTRMEVWYKYEKKKKFE